MPPPIRICRFPHKTKVTAARPHLNSTFHQTIFPGDAPQRRDRAATILLEMGVGSGIVDLGGDIRVLGPHPDGSPWRVGIRNPNAPERAVVAVHLAGGAIATSGDYERAFLLEQGLQRPTEALRARFFARTRSLRTHKPTYTAVQNESDKSSTNRRRFVHKSSTIRRRFVDESPNSATIRR